MKLASAGPPAKRATRNSCTENSPPSAAVASTTVPAPPTAMLPTPAVWMSAPTRLSVPLSAVSRKPSSW